MDRTAREKAAGSTTGTTLVRLEGAETLDLLHRISTQDMSDLAPGMARATLFCDFRGRLLHRAIAARTADGAVWLLRDDAGTAELIAYLERFIFRESVRVADRGERGAVVGVAGGVGLEPGTVRERDGVIEAVQVDAEFGMEVVAVASPTTPARTAPPAEAQAPAPTAAAVLDPAQEVAEVARIRAGRPRHDHEIAEAFNPFEVNLAHEVHLDKGCFTGQEALQRLVTYHSVRRRLVRLSGRGTPPAAPADACAGDAVVGRLTSVAREGDGWIGLAVVRNEACDSGEALTIEGREPVREAVPFERTRPLGRP